MPDAQEPIDLAKAKLHLRVDSTDDDTLIEGLISAAREYVEDYTGLVLMPRTIVESAPALGRWVDLDAWPIADLADIALSYVDADGVSQDIEAAGWRASSIAARPIRIMPKAPGWGVSGGMAICQTLPVTITVNNAGYTSPDLVPGAIKAAMLMIIGHLYANREEVLSGAAAAAVQMPVGVEALLTRWRVMRI